MSEMVERVARAICTASFQGWPDDTYNGRGQKRFYRNQARAAIEAMREPTDAMTAGLPAGLAEEIKATWRDCIDAALKDRLTTVQS